MIVWILLLFFKLNAAELNEVCDTPNGEQAKCIPINSCLVIKQAIAYLNPEAIEFARASQCGYENGPLVCCGTIGRKTTLSPPSTTAPSTQSVPPPEENFSLSPLDDQQLPDGTLCGIQIKQPDNRIIGGNISDIYDFPWMVALKYRKPDGSDAGFRCGGTLISSTYVLTAAQCLEIRGFNLVEVRLGEWQISSSEDCAPNTESEMVCADPVMDLKIISKIAHPFFSLRSGNNDIALLKLEKKVKFTDFIRPICLPPPELPIPKEGTMMDIAGWGITENGKQSDYKLKVQVPVLGNEKCKKIYTDYTHINPNQACAGGEHGKDACDGDSGGPLMTVFEKNNIYDEDQWYQEGIIYRGLGCGRRGVPSLYTRISRYSKWIVNTIHSSR